ncbi:isoprenylcysteine carboxylmethyltransferase family protein [Photobacterium rosenbergii]|uniref:Isoprenylcysteine carboxylmethyltransferase family protein n=1 Tax=Photobacterium rosenbergii TaxID=294936 RepID=A0ABU3ZD32_9GAMM|nr:isoprenylcysteine carboxylmethyltransferase family protein [Photobacterium rosenbergii]MDV5167818.1 isoprenylcysteine carboxylmethyltransferase family protein [Photobacterium rosenbergii]
MELRLPPPLVLLITLGCMYALARYWPLYAFSFSAQTLIILVFCLLGTFLGLAAVWSFSKARTTIDPRLPNKTSKLVTSGIYRFSRNPMYLGLLCFLCAAFVYLSALSPLLMLGLFVFYMNNFQIAPEEAVLQAMFGEQFDQYCQRVRRWC